MLAYYEDPIPSVLKAIGCFEKSRSLWRFRWGEVSWRWGLTVKLTLFEEGWSLVLQLIYGKWFIHLPRWLPKWEPHELLENYGFSWQWFDDGPPSLHLGWGRRSKVVFLPWRWEHHKTEILRKDGTWRLRKNVHLKSDRPYDHTRDPLSDVHVEQHPYYYMLDNGEVQKATANVVVERSEICLYWLRWLGWPRRRRQYIDVWFSQELGEEAGSWKGGVLGCGYEMKPGEAPKDTLRRMQRERRFR